MLYCQGKNHIYVYIVKGSKDLLQNVMSFPTHSSNALYDMAFSVLCYCSFCSSGSGSLWSLSCTSPLCVYHFEVFNIPFPLSLNHNLWYYYSQIFTIIKWHCIIKCHAILWMWILYWSRITSCDVATAL